MEKSQLKKKLDNYWYYYKMPTVAVILIVLVTLYFLWNNMHQINYDYQVALVTTETISDNDCQKLQDALAACGADRNKDGQIHVQLIPYIFQQGENIDPQRALAVQVQFIGDMELGRSPLYIYSEEIYELFKEEGFFPTESSERFSLKTHTTGLPDVFDTMYLSLFEYTRIDNNNSEEIISYYKDCNTLLDLFINN